MTRPATYLVVGADGMLGSALVAVLPRTDASVLATSRTGRPGTIPLDLAADPSSWHLPAGIDAAFLCAGMTSVPGCRTMPDRAWDVNVRGTAALARRLVESGTFVVFPSSNRVFDGSVPFQRADAPTCPMTEYGRTKAAAERELLALGSGVAVIRFTKIIGPRSPMIVEWRERLLHGSTIHPYTDMVMAPLGLHHATDIVTSVARLRAGGISQASGARDVSFEEAGRRLCSLLEVPDSLVRPILSTEGARGPDHVPAHTTLDAGRITTLTGLAPPSLAATLQAVLRPPG